nr:aminotransferase class IV [Kribbella shirazensis]
MLLNGAPASALDPATLRAASYGHFTSMQVRDGCVDGLDLHFARLDRSTREVFGQPLPADRVRADLRAAVRHVDSGDLSIRVNVFATTDLNLLVHVGPPVAPSTQLPRLLAVQHERAVPHLKHTGTFDLIYYGRQAQQSGYDSAVFHTASGEISEATIWNICFARGSQIVFPAARVLPGTRQQVLQRGLGTYDAIPVRLTDLPTYDAAYLTNSVDAALPVASITLDGSTVDYAPHDESVEVIAKAYATQPPQPV